jgi:hypothetical protein
MKGAETFGSQVRFSARLSVPARTGAAYLSNPVRTCDQYR